MRNEAVKALAHGNPDLAQRALNRERQANKIFVLLLRLIFTAYQNPNLARAVGLDSGFPLIGYRTVAKNLELTADNAEDIAEIVIDAGENTLDVDDATLREIREFTDTVNEMTELGVRSVVERDYDLALQTKKLFRDVEDSQTEILTSLPEMDNDKLLQVREVLVALQQTAQYAVRNAEIATNLALDTNSEYVTIT